MKRRERAVLPCARLTLQDTVYEHLRARLIEGTFKPGQRLTVRGIASELAVSPMPVREAFRRLIAEGGLDAPKSTAASRVPELGRERFLEITEVRVHNEGLAAQWAAANVTTLDLKELARLEHDATRAIRLGHVEDIARTNERFHFAVYRLSRSPELFSIIESLWLKVGPTIALHLNRRDQPQSHLIPKRHGDVIHALARRDGDAARRAIEHDIRGFADGMLDGPWPEAE